jgi:hypothetical protein
MRHILLVASFLITFSVFTSSNVLAIESTDASSDDQYLGEVLCLPDQIGNYPLGQCLEMGPYSYKSRMANIGISFPFRPFQAESPDSSLTYIEFGYGEVVALNAPVYNSLEAAAKRDKDSIVRKIDSPYSYISYSEEVYVDGKRFYMVEYGGYMTANEVSRIGAPSNFQGVNFESTPERQFGWILFPTQTKKSPGFDIDDYTGRELNRYDVVQIFDIQNIGEMNWYMIAPDEWIPEKYEYQRRIGRVIPNTSPPENVQNGRWIEVNLGEQTLSVYDNHELIFATLVASGLEPFWTRPGLFQIYEKHESTPMRGSFEADRSDAYYLEDVPWTMYFDKARALHGAYWHNKFGTELSHGCVNLSVGDSHWLFDWAEMGDWVYVWDSTGRTPTDPAMYGEGGA